MPIVVDEIGMELLDDGWPFPKIPIQVGWRGCQWLGTDRVSFFAAVAVSDFEFAKLARLDGFM